MVLLYNTIKWQRTVVECDDVKTVHQLSFVLMDTLHLTVKHGVNVDLDVVVLKDVVSQSIFVPLHKSTKTHLHYAKGNNVIIVLHKSL